ncbi:MAG: hypothetical protein M1812_000505 [Candelaria pacifica]|nr:MAG: hypothetical protein M1812_000505 [Candelaria pacifica]
MPAFSRLVQFIAKDSRKYYGEAILPPGVTDLSKVTQAHVIKGNILGNHEVTEQIADVKRLLAPLSRDYVRTVRCLGLNYEQHAKEVIALQRTGVRRHANSKIVRHAHTKVPSALRKHALTTCSISQRAAYPNTQYKPITSLTGPFDNITIPEPAQEVEGVDYECELVAVIGKKASNVPESKALEYVLGYAVGNDVSHREWQFKRGGGQWSLGKGFDRWAPWGPGLVTSRIIKDPQALNISTKVNGETVQQSSTKDMIFSVAQTIAFLSQGTTLLPGDLIFTGTPQGVGSGKKPPLWLKDGDVVEVGLEGVGTCVNKVEHVKSRPKL